MLTDGGNVNRVLQLKNQFGGISKDENRRIVKVENYYLRDFNLKL